jgi:hypothetical protein
MRVWAITAALFMGLVMWGADQLDLNYAGGGEQTMIVDGGGADNGTVTAMEDPYGPPKP